MKGVLLDENLPAHLALPTSLPIEHVSGLGKRPSDTDIWNHARVNDLTIVSKDADFSFRIAAAKPPPRVVHLRIGNMRTRELRSTIERLWPQIERSLKSGKLINVYSDRIEFVA